MLKHKAEFLKYNKSYKVMLFAFIYNAKTPIHLATPCISFVSHTYVTRLTLWGKIEIRNCNRKGVVVNPFTHL